MNNNFFPGIYVIIIVSLHSLWHNPSKLTILKEEQNESRIRN